MKLPLAEADRTVAALRALVARTPSSDRERIADGASLASLVARLDAHLAAGGATPTAWAQHYRTVKSVAEEIGVSTMTIHREINSGALRAKRIGRSIRIRQADFDAYLEAGEIKPGGPGWTVVGHWENDRVVVEYVLPGEVEDERVDDGFWEQGLWAEHSPLADREEAVRTVVAAAEAEHGEGIDRAISAEEAGRGA